MPLDKKGPFDVSINSVDVLDFNGISHETNIPQQPPDPYVGRNAGTGGDDYDVGILKRLSLTSAGCRVAVDFVGAGDV